MLTRNTRVDALRGLSVLALCLVIASTHISALSDYEPFNFEMVYQGRQRGKGGVERREREGLGRGGGEWESERLRG